MGAPDRFEVVEPSRAFGALAPAWESLLERSASDSPFLSTAWLGPWWRAYGARRKPALVFAWRGRDLEGIIPLQLVAAVWRGGIPLRALRFFGDGTHDSDYLDVIVPENREDPVVTAFWSWLKTRAPIRFEVAHLNELPVASPGYAALRRVVDGDGSVLGEDRIGCVIAPLPATYETYIASLKPRMRTKLRSLRRTLEERHGARLVRCEAASLEETLESLFRLHERRWTARGESGVFAAPEKRAFYHVMAGAHLALGRLDLTTLVVEDRPVAHQCCIRYRGAAYLLQEGYDPDWEEHGVGNVLRAMTIEAMIRDGVRTYDFLAGVTPHKLSWGGEVKESARLTLRGSGPYAALANGMTRLAAARARLRAVFSRSGPRR